ncbi:BREX-2 system adenine-specific DNA-methyltransferase PglX [Amnibacterium soli]|uniref:site-specific DNA-methyltransferase (adenine-specific) n=1 Tax=Amnibacterium soli TaxID=1282736 RepID=A0ABP8YZF1_9MICO
MIDSALLLADLKRELKSLEADLRVRAEDDADPWGARLRDEYETAKRRERTGLAWIEWRDGEVSQAAVAWILASVFIRFAEDNGLLEGAQRDGRPVALPWIAAPGEGIERAVENEQAYYAATPTATSRDWLQDAFRTLADLPAGRTLVDPDHSAVWHAPISANASDRLLAFFRHTTAAGNLMHDFRDPELGTRFLGDLYQDLSDYAKKTYALLQTPVFVEEFILDQTLTPAIAEFGLTGLKMIDPACGSGHFLLGAFNRLTAAWAETAPSADKGERVQRALDSIHGVDLNPFAIAVARFRLTTAAIKAAGIRTLVGAPEFRYRLAIGDSLLGSVDRVEQLDMTGEEYFEYHNEDLSEYADILRGNRYHVVVANPPYIQPSDPKLRDQYRALYSTCHRKYALSVPFMELLFRLARRGGAGGAGYVGQITSNAFMKREFGKKLIQEFLSGEYTGSVPEHVELTYIIDTSRAWIPGHNSEGTATAILVGRPRKPQSSTVRAVLGVRGEPSRPAVAADGLVWRDIVEHLDSPGYQGQYVSIADVPRSAYRTFPWSLSGGGAGELKKQIESASTGRLGDQVAEIGIVAVLGEEAPFEVPPSFRGPTIGLVSGESVRDWSLREVRRYWPYDAHLRPNTELGKSRWLWPYRAVLRNVIFFGKSPAQRGFEWYQYVYLAANKLRTPLSIAYPEVASHNHFVLDRGGKVFNRPAPVIKLAPEATEDDYYDILGVLNSSVACFWTQEVSQQKQGGDERWDWHFQVNTTKLHPFPLPLDRARDLARQIDERAQARSATLPEVVLANWGPGALAHAHLEWIRLGSEMVALQEELDWRMYVAYGLADPQLSPKVEGLAAIQPNERPFEIGLARAVARGETETAWFNRHGRLPLTELPEHWSSEYRDLIERRLAAIASNPGLGVLEQPEYKRRWSGVSWEELVNSAVQGALLGRLDSADLWRDASGRPLVRSAAQIADELRHDEGMRELMAIYTGSQDYDFANELGRLLASKAVPAVAASRYKPSGIEKSRAWERTWDAQRAEDRGERVQVPVPPKYVQADFLKASYWSARGKLDVPKERFVAFPGSKLPDDVTDVYGWGGWDSRERGQAIARFANELSRAGSPAEQVVPLVGALIEVEPWLRQWHDELDTRTGVSPAAAVESIITTLLGRLGLGRDEILAWRPPAPTRGRKSAS